MIDPIILEKNQRRQTCKTYWPPFDRAREIVKKKRKKNEKNKEKATRRIHLYYNNAQLKNHYQSLFRRECLNILEIVARCLSSFTHVMINYNDLFSTEIYFSSLDISFVVVYFIYRFVFLHFIFLLIRRKSVILRCVRDRCLCIYINNLKTVC